MKKKKHKKLKPPITNRQWYYQDAFDALMDIAMRHPRPPKKLLEAWDAVADFIGDVAKGRRK